MALEVLIVFVVLAGFTYKFLQDKSVWHKLQISRLEKSPLIVELMHLLVKLASFSAEKRFQLVADYCEPFPNLVKVWIGPKVAICVNDPDRIQKVLMSSKCLEKMNFFYKLMERDSGLISGSTRNMWKAHRKFFNFSFGLSILESFLPTYIECSETLVETLLKESKNGEFDFFDYAKKVSFDMLLETSLGTNIKEFRNQSIYEKVFDAYET
jgi:cytochrome P450